MKKNCSERTEQSFGNEMEVKINGIAVKLHKKRKRIIIRFNWMEFV